MAEEELNHDAAAAKRTTKLGRNTLHKVTEHQIGSEIEDLYKHLKTSLVYR